MKQEVYRVAARYRLYTIVVANRPMRVPDSDCIQLVVVDDQFDAADDWIVAQVTMNDIVISADIPLAARCLEKGARVLDQRGGIFTEDSIGEALASRGLLSQLREMGTMVSGPAPFEKRDRPRFLQQLDQTIHAIKRAASNGVL